LQVLDDGRLTDGQGKTVNFANTIVILTSNLGADKLADFDGDARYEDLKDAVMGAVRNHFRPEFINRLDEVIVFRRLTLDAMKPIVDIQLKRLRRLLDDRKIELQITDEVLTLLATEGYEPAYGARPLKRLIQRKIQDPLSETILEGKVTDRSRVRVALKDQQILIEAVKGE
ncbi:MAG TPA: AAA family ATPase, partial [Planctomycetota bacterium]|nr:AAA family ATPase [Planctomycetota bacterium]